MKDKDLTFNYSNERFLASIESFREKIQDLNAIWLARGVKNSSKPRAVKKTTLPKTTKKEKSLG